MSVAPDLRSALLRACPQFADILDMASYRPGYLPYPARVTVRLASGNSHVCVLKADADAASIQREAQVYAALEDLAFAAPRLLGNDAFQGDNGELLTFLVLSELPGEPLPWLDLNDLTVAYRTCQLASSAIDALHELTPRLLTHPVAAALPAVTLAAELQATIARGGPWLREPTFARALTLLQDILPNDRGPLVFSNGDYNPLNFLWDGSTVTGWLDFVHARFEDPLIGLAKFLLWADDAYGWGAGAKAGFVERYLYEHDIAPHDFLVRLVLRGLSHLQETDPGKPPRYMQKVIADAVERLASAC